MIMGMAGAMTAWRRAVDQERMDGRYSLHRSPLPSASTRRLLQLRDSEGPPPLEVPRKKTDMVGGAMFR
jgi:hypothetical protein